MVKSGPLVGWRLPRGIEDWKRSVVAFDRSQLDGEAIQALSLVLPEDRIDASEFPRLHEVAQRCPWVARPEEELSALLKRGLTVLYVSWHRVAGGGAIELRSEGAPTRGFGGEFPGPFRISKMDRPQAEALLRSMWGDEWTADDVEKLVTADGDDLDDPYEFAPTVDRLLGAITNGAADEETVELATDLLDCSEDRKAMARWERWLEHIHGYAEPMRENAKTIANAINVAQPGTEVSVPIYESVRCVLLPELQMATSDRDTKDYPLRIPERTVVLVDPAPDGSTWAELGSQLFADPADAVSKSRSRGVVLFFIAVLIAVLAYTLTG